MSLESWLPLLLAGGAAFLPALAAKTMRSRVVWLVLALGASVPLLQAWRMAQGDWVGSLVYGAFLQLFMTACLILGATGASMLMLRFYERRHGTSAHGMVRIGIVVGTILALLGLLWIPGLVSDYQACQVRRAVIDDILSARGEGAELDALREEITASASLATESGRTDELANVLVERWHPSLKRGYMLYSAVPSELTADENEFDLRAREQLLQLFTAFGEGLYYSSSGGGGGGSIGDGLHADGERASALSDLPDGSESRVEFDYPSCALFSSTSAPRSVLNDAEIRRFDLVSDVDDNAVPVARFWLASEDGSDWFVVGLERLFD